MKHKKKNRLLRQLIAYLFCFSSATLIILLSLYSVLKLSHKSLESQCKNNSQVIILLDNVLDTKEGIMNENEVTCYEFNLEKESYLTIESENPIILYTPNQETIEIEQKFQGLLSKIGKYTIILQAEKQANYQFSLIKQDQLPVRNENNELVYNVTKHPKLYYSQQLQVIVNNIVQQAKNKSLPVNYLSISLLDLNSNQTECCGYASYQGNQPRYPASVVKLFWITALFGRYQAGEISPNILPEKLLIEMIQDSDNEAASQVLDVVTDTNSGQELSPEEIKEWKDKREFVNRFFVNAGYNNLNISQKTFPIPYLKMDSPQGRDLQIRDKNLQLKENLPNPIRNSMTTDHVARLLYEIRSDLAISKNYSDRLDKLITRDLNPAAWKDKPFNAISGFLGEYLPPDTRFSSKMGWTFNNRNDAAIIASSDGKIQYILVVFGDHPSFYENKTFFPEISRYVYQEMSNLSNK